MPASSWALIRAEWRATNLFLSANKKPNYYYNLPGVYVRRVDPSVLVFSLFITPTLIYRSSLYLSLYRFIINKGLVLLTRSENITMTIIKIHLNLTSSPFYLLLVVRLGDYMVNLLDFILTVSSGNWPLFSSFRSSDSTSSTSTAPSSPHNSNREWATSSPKRNFTDHFKYRRSSYSFTITHSPITLTKFSFINLVYIFRCSSPPSNPVCARRVDPSAFNLSF